MTSGLKNILLTVLCLLFVPVTVLCQTVPALVPQWFGDAGSASGNATPTAARVDAGNNVYVIGSFTGTVDFNPSPANTTALTAPSGSTYGFVAKYASDGTFAWAYAFAGPDVFPTGISIGTGGALSVTGKFSGTMDANTNGGNTLTSTGGYDAFVVRLNANGGYLWSDDIGGVTDDSGNSVANDDNGNTYVGLQFQQTATVGNTSYTAKGGTNHADGMLIKYSALGDVLFVIDLGYTGFDNTVSSLAVDKDGNIDVAGYLNGAVDFNPLGVLNRRSAQKSLFVVQYSPIGAFNWINTIGDNFTDNTQTFKVAVDKFGRVYVVGSYTSPAWYLANASLNPKGSRDVFIGQYSQTGGFTAFKNIGSAGATVLPADVAISPDGNNIYISGTFTGNVDFSTNNAFVTKSYHGKQDLFLGRYTTSNLNLSALATSGNNTCNNVSAAALAPTNDNGVIVAGTFCSTVDFGDKCPEPETAVADYDMFLAKYTQAASITNNIISNPANCGGTAGTLLGTQPAGGTGTYTYQWQRSTDGTNFTEIIAPGNAATSMDYTPPNETGTFYYLRKVFSGPCEFNLSNPLKVDPSSPTVKNNFINPPAPPESTVGCGAAGASNLTGSLPTGGGDKYSYQWQITTDTIGGNWTNMQASIVTFPTNQNLGAVSYLYTFYLRRLVFTPGCNVPSISPVMMFTAVPKLQNIDSLRATGPTTFCGSGDPGTLMSTRPPTGGSGVYTYQWLSTTSDNFQPIDSATNADYKPGVLTKTTFFKREVYAGPCYTGIIGLNSNQVSIFIKTPITITNNTIATSDGTLCLASADPALITGQQVSGGTGSFYYQWQQSTDNVHFSNLTANNPTGKDYDPPKISQTTYYRRVVTYVDDDHSNTCSTPNLSNVVVVKVSTVNVSNNTISQPQPDTSVICSIPATPKFMQGSDATGTGFTYQWQNSVDGIHFSDINGATGRDYQPKPISQTMSYRRAAVSTDPCLAPLYSDTLTINVSATASANYITAPADTAFCDQGDADFIKGSVVTGNGVTYQWQSSTDNVIYQDIMTGNPNYPDYNPPPGSTTVYYRRLVSTAVCNVPSASNAVAIRVYHTPAAIPPDSVTVCAGDRKTITVAGGNTYQWSPADGLSATNIASPSASPAKTTLYTVAVSDSGHCAVTTTFKVIVIPKPIVDAGPDIRMFKGDHAQLKAKVTGSNVTYSWSPTTGLDNPNSLNPVVSPTETTTYQLTAITDQGCSLVTDKVTVNVYEKVIIPNSFTPNSDGHNDMWEIVGLSTYTKSILTVFNRNGATIFRSVGYSKPWDGQVNGSALPFGTYYYVIDLQTGDKPLSGWVTIIK
ncbi:gliding motility-associated C-terminal domain-containing protein [Mucilaginibacter ximonensis]|uniref:Gliding motility-associated C-terminal domain-containing protein n=1 Tax=Mucilaginibacter ximonensis TaxID=538021 RepID=A0ABW5YGX9_9SPHI